MTGFESKRAAVADKLQEPSITRPCRSCNGTGDRDTGIPESPIATCKPCTGTGQIALAQPAQEPIAWMYQCTADNSGPVLLQHRTNWAESNSGLWIETPLYTTPPQPAQKPVAYVTGMSFGRFIVEPLNPAMVLPVGMALYSSPQGNT